LFYHLLHIYKTKLIKALKECYYWVIIKPNFFSWNPKILIVKNDAIGDYVLFNIFLFEIKQSIKFKNYSIDILTNERLKPIVKELNNDLVNTIHTTNNDVFIYWGKFLHYFNILKKERYEYILHPTYSANWETHYFVKYIKAKYKIGFDGDLINISEEYKKKYNPIYTSLIKSHKRYIHEFERNLEFFKIVLQKNITINKTYLPIIIEERSENSNVILICPGAQHSFRIWGTKNLAELILSLQNWKSNLQFVVAVSPNEIQLYESIKSQCNVPIIIHNITSISKLCIQMQQSKLVICNDSSAAHIAVANNVNSICISNGNNLGRFVPYPKWMNIKQTVILPPVFNHLNNDEKMKYYAGSDIDINSITVDSVLNSCKLFL